MTNALLEALIDNLDAALAGMSKATGYWFDYGPFVPGGLANFNLEHDLTRPSVHRLWLGTTTNDSLTGGEMQTRRMRHNERFLVTVAFSGGDTVPAELNGRRIRQDIHRAIFLDRTRGGSRVNTFDPSNVEVTPIPDENGIVIGGVLSYEVIVRHEHATGDMTSQ